MARFVLIAPATAETPPGFGPLAERLAHQGWRRTVVSKAVVLHPMHSRFAAFIGGAMSLFGELYDREGRPASMERLLPLLDRTDIDLTAEILGRFWGRYVVVRFDPSGVPISVFRDPSGGLEVFAWRAAGHVLVASDPIPEVLAAFTPDLTIDRDIVGDYLAEASSISARCALKGVHLVPPGARLDLSLTAPPVQVWRPATFARAHISNREEAETRLRAGVGSAVQGLAHCRALLAEISGGLDSSIVGATLHTQHAQVRAWLNLSLDQRAGDERRYARQLAHHLGIPLTEVTQAPLVFDPSVLSVVQAGFVPSLNGLDPGYDADLIGVAEAAKVEAIITGLGGDTVFFSSHSVLAIQDHVRRLGWRAWSSPFLGDLARWTRRSAVSLIKLGLGPAVPPAYPMVLPPWISRRQVDRPHPWLDDAADLSPAKHLQLQSLTHQLASVGRSRRGERFEILYPLLAQPVVETALAIPIDLLVEGGRDRALARRTFAPILPAAIAERRSKGDFSYRFAAALTKGLPAIRAFLLDGRLARMGLIDRQGLEAALDESVLAQYGGATHPLRVAALEAWVRYWEELASALKATAATPAPGSDPARP